MPELFHEAKAVIKELISSGLISLKEGASQDTIHISEMEDDFLDGLSRIVFTSDGEIFDVDVKNKRVTKR